MIGSTLIRVFQCVFVIIVLISLVHSSLTQSLQYFWYTFKYLITRHKQALVLTVFQIYEYLVSTIFQELCKALSHPLQHFVHFTTDNITEVDILILLTNIQVR